MCHIYKDHPPMGGQVLGSFQSITNEDGDLIEKLSFDPWGRRRNADDWTLDIVPEDYQKKPQPSSQSKIAVVFHQ
jgi:hypothetical protein